MMKDLSLFLVKNSLGGKMRKGFRSTFCNGDDSTSTLDRHLLPPPPPSDHHLPLPLLQHDHNHNQVGTLEEMILKLELEEEKARKYSTTTTNNREHGINHGRKMSYCNNNNNSSDILMSARNAAMSQYPRFSLDGKDAMYRSSFRNNDNNMKMMELEQGRRSVCCGELKRLRGRLLGLGGGGGGLVLPPTLAGESVVWCKPGVVAKLMGLDAMPMPVKRRSIVKQEKIIMDGVDRHQHHHHHRVDIMDGGDEKEMLFKMRSNNNNKKKSSYNNNNGYNCNNNNNNNVMMKPVMEVHSGGGGGSGRRRFH
ncbi:hypothetical protein CsatB_015968 [Cannabis sativa]